MADEDGQCALFMEGDEEDGGGGADHVVSRSDRFKQVYHHEIEDLFVRDKTDRIESWDVVRSNVLFSRGRPDVRPDIS